MKNKGRSKHYYDFFFRTDTSYLSEIIEPYIQNNFNIAYNEITKKDKKFIYVNIKDKTVEYSNWKGLFTKENKVYGKVATQISGTEMYTVLKNILEIPSTNSKIRDYFTDLNTIRLENE